MPTIGSKVMSARLRREDWKAIERQMDSWGCETFADWVKRVLHRPGWDDLETVLGYLELPEEDFCKQVYDMILDGDIEVEDGKMRVNALDLSGLQEVCRDKNLRPQVMVDRLVADIRGQ